MTSRLTNEYAPDRVSPPGETLAETLTALDMTQAELATRLGRPKKTVNEIIRGKAAIEPDTALQLEAVLGVPADFWMTRETRYRESLARQSRRQALHYGTEWTRWFPFAQMSKLGWVPATPPSGRIDALLRFFGVASPEAWAEIWHKREVAFRRSLKRRGKETAVAAWLRQGEILASRCDCARYDAARFRTVLDEARLLTREEPAVFQPRLTEAFASAGVALVWLPELRGATVSGATRWLSDEKALVQVSLRYKCDDQLFFSLFHEAAHVLLHRKSVAFLEGLANDTPEERQANRFAADLLIPAAAYQELVTHNLSLERITAFANRLRIAPGIVVGRLQHDKRLPFNHGNQLKRRLTWA
jgi:HTH-type transcriptional regulator/antitoxin HigA